MPSKTGSNILLVIDFDGASGKYTLSSASVRLTIAPDPSEDIEEIVNAVKQQYPNRDVMFHKDSRLPELSY